MQRKKSMVDIRTTAFFNHALSPTLPTVSPAERGGSQKAVHLYGMVWSWQQKAYAPLF
jgi:hypothetical protein